MNKNQDRQIDERAKLSDRYHRAMEEKKTELSAYYRLDERRQEIGKLRERVDHPSLFRRMTGKAANDRRELAGQEESCRDAEVRMAEHLSVVSTERDFAVSDQTDRHARENELTRGYIAERRPAFYAEEKAPAQERLGRGGGGQSRDDGAGGRERVHHHHAPHPWPSC